MKLVIAEKPSVAMSLAAVLGATEGLLQCFPNKRRLEYINGSAYFRRSKIYRYLCNWQEKGKRDWQPTYTVKG